MDKHPESTVLSTFGRGRLSRRRNREIVRHLLARCESCCRTASRFLPPARPGVAAPSREVRELDYGTAFCHAWRETERRQTALMAERTAAPGLLRQLLAEPFERRRSLVTTEARYLTWSFCELILDTARESGFQDPAEALDLANLGLEVAARIHRPTARRG
jgi:hypothetical protein